jgi:glycosyltransferase involved in cell wall biosynthesis
MEQDMNIVLHNLDIETTLPHLPIGKTFRESIETWRRVIRQAKPAPTQTPPIQKAEGKVSIVTITHNRVPWWPNMVQNVLSQSWNQKDIEWVIVDDDQTLIGQVGQLQRDYPDLTVKYVQMQNDIGTKRNAGVKAATSDIVVFMDDDDHYPKDSVYNRVKGLQADCVYCATLPIYDIRHYESSMLGPAVKKLPYQRASVASLAFRKSFWAARPFPEGDSDAEFLKGRELETVELSPKDVIVAFLHKGNPKARFGSDEKEKPKEPNGCHYGFSEKYFTYLHQIGMDS